MKNTFGDHRQKQDISKITREIISEIVAFDLEIDPDSGKIFKIGALDPATGNTLIFQGNYTWEKAAPSLDLFVSSAKYILGHNILMHDLPRLKKKQVRLKLCGMPAIDTLFLSPLAFPRNPYHHLVKDYKLVRENVNDPVADSRCAVKLFQDQIEAFMDMDKGISGAYGALLENSYPGHGFGHLFERITGTGLPNTMEIMEILILLTRGKACDSGAREVFNKKRIESRESLSLAYAFSWVKIAGENSVLPSWVRLNFPQIPHLLDLLRGSPCNNDSCSFCKKHNDSRVGLKHFFGFESFLPVKDEDPPLQQEIVEEINRGGSCLAVLPTGAGKSLCYQLPGLMKAALRNQLVLIISPLQSLMKDQVDALKKKGIVNVGTINGLLTMLERSQTMEGVVMGDIDLLWVAPEQLRNTSVKSVIKQRELGMLVIDEAHCFSKWGHDFRPDYLYIARFILEICHAGGMRVPQMTCFTATAKKEVVSEILLYFKKELNLDLVLFAGGHERSNLRFQVERAPENQKPDIIHNILESVLGESGGGGIVFVSTRKRAEILCKKLEKKEWAVDYFHGGRTPDDKNQVQEKFMAGDLRVIIATNAFGMGIDKPDVRVVIHADVPGSLENYLQEAGRAGRDRKPAACFLLFDTEDLETQFKLNSLGRLQWKDLSSMFTGLKKLSSRNPDHQVVITSGELIRSPEVEEEGIDLSTDQGFYDTKVKTALAWLEKSGKLLREDNRTQVVQGKVLVNNLEKGEKIISSLNLSSKEKIRWNKILKELFQADEKELLNTDTLSQTIGVEPDKMISIIRSMSKAGIINHDLNMTAYIHHGIAVGSKARLAKYLSIEKALIKFMEEEEPDAGPEQSCVLRTRMAAQVLKEKGIKDTRPHQILQVLELLAGQGLVRRSRLEEDTYKLYFRKDLGEIRDSLNHREAVCVVILNYLISKLDDSVRGKDLLVSFRSGEVISVLQNDITTRFLDNQNDRLKSGLLALHGMRAITLQSGLAVFRPAMSIRVTSDAMTKFTKEEFRPLEEFQKEKIVQIHIIGRYAQLSMEAVKRALAFVDHYFTEGRESFLKRYFKNEKKLLEMPTTSAVYKKIVKDLKNPVQEKTVQFSGKRAQLIIAGPGSGKTRIIVHRIAYLIRVKRVMPRHIIAIAYNRSAVTQLKKRLKDLIGREASWVRIHTYHSLSMLITGRAFSGINSVKNESFMFDQVLREAVALLEDASGDEHGVLGWRDTLFSGLKYILVDEYQDINEIEYRLLSLLAGKNEKSVAEKPSIMAVGDDDQNIYSWQGSSIRYIRQFQDDYDAELIYMVKNYRSTRPIVQAADSLISRNRDRMKTSITLECDRAEPGNKAVLITTPCRAGMLKAALQKASALLENDNALSPGDVCILTRRNTELDSLQIMARGMGIPVRGIRLRNLPAASTREFRVFIDSLLSCRKDVAAGESIGTLVHDLVSASGFSESNIWVKSFQSLVESYLAETMNSRLPIGNFLDYIFDASRDKRNFQRFHKDNIIISTIHMAKGLEFPAVIIAGRPLAAAGMEDERRLYYVAMTRAMDHLYMVDNEQEPLPFVSDLKSCHEQSLIHKTVDPGVTPEEEKALGSELWDMELNDLVISYPAYKNIYKSAQKILSSMEPGFHESLFLNKRGKYFEVFYHKTPFARLSLAGVEKLMKKYSRGLCVEKVIFLASIQWSVHNEPEEFKGYSALESWYTGIFQILFSKPL